MLDQKTMFDQAMVDQLFEDFHKATESSLQMQQELLKSWAQQLLRPHTFGVVAGQGQSFQKHWSEFATEALSHSRGSLESAYQSGLQIVEQTFKASEAKSPEEYRQIVENLWRKLLENLKDQSECQLRDFYKWAETSLEVARMPQFG